MNRFGLGSIHASGIVWDRLVVYGGLGGCGKLGSIAPLVILLVHDEAQKVVEFLLHIVREREEDCGELFAKSREISIGGLPRNGVKYV